MDKTEFQVLDASGNPYKAVGEAKILYGAVVIADVETPTGDYKSATLSFDHYAVVRKLKGSGLGGLGALVFARHVTNFFPKVSLIKFDLFRQEDGDDPILLRDAREKLFLSLGATCSYRKIPGTRNDPPRWIVEVRWKKENWDHPELLAALEQRLIAQYAQKFEKPAKSKTKMSHMSPFRPLQWLKGRLKRIVG